MDVKEIKLNYAGLYALLDKNDMNRNALVKRAGLTHNAILSIKNGEPIAMAALLKICTYFHCDISDVVKIDFDPVDNRNYFFFKITEALEESGNECVLLHREEDNAVFWATDNYGFAGYPIATISLDLANHISDVNDLRELASDSVKGVLSTAAKIDQNSPILTDSPDMNGNNAIDLKDGTWYSCNGPIE